MFPTAHPNLRFGMIKWRPNPTCGHPNLRFGYVPKSAICVKIEHVGAQIIDVGAATGSYIWAPNSWYA